MMRLHRARLSDTMLSDIVFLKCNTDNMDMKWCTDWIEIIVNVEQSSCQVFYLLCTLQRMGSQLFVNVFLTFHLKSTFLHGGGQVILGR